MLDCAELARKLAPVAARAGAAILEFYGKSVSVAAKADSSPVTEADRRAEAIILAGLAEHWPDIPVIAEEETERGVAPRGRLDLFFLVDPLDGTKEFIKQLDDFTVNIALVRKQTPCFGLVYAPARQLLFVTLGRTRAIEMKCSESFDVKEAEFTAARALRVRQAPAEGLTAVTSRSHANAATEEFIGALKVAHEISAGSSLKFALLARGEADVYPRLAPTMEWDTAAGHAVLTAAGGSVLTGSGQPLTCGHFERGYRNPGFVAWGGRD